MNILAIDVGGTFTKYAVIDKSGHMLAKDKRPTAADSLESFIASLAGIYEDVGTRFDLAGIALSMAGIIDSKQGFMYTGGSIGCIKNLNIVEVLERKCQVPVTVENDAKCAALAERWQGVLTDCQDAVVIVCGTGVGGAVIRGGEVIRGSHFMAGEFSYLLTESAEGYTMDNCLASRAGIGALIQYVSEETGIPAEELDGIRVFSMANSGDERALAGLRRFVRYLAVQIHNYQYIFDPQRIAIGGGISVQPLFLQLIKEELKTINAMYPWTLPMPDVVTCRFFNDANLIGAVYVHVKANEKKINNEKLKAFIDQMGDRREGAYLRSLLMD